MGASSGTLGSGFVSLGPVVIPPAVLLCCLMAGCGRTSAVACDKPWRTARFLAKSCLAAGIDTRPGGGPQTHDDAQRCATRWAQGAARLWGDARCRMAIETAGRHDHQAERVGGEGSAGMEQAARADGQDAVRQDMVEEPAEKC